MTAYSNRMGAVRALLRRKLFDWSFHPAVRWTVSASLFAGYLLRGGDGKPNAYRLLLRAHRYAARQGLGLFFERFIQRHLAQWLTQTPPLSPPSALSNGQLRSFYRRTLVLKVPRLDGDRVVEKGVLFTKTFGELMTLTDLKRLLQDYTLVIEPGWSGYAEPNLLALCAFHEHDVVVCSPEPTDYDFLMALNCNLVPVRLGASDWVNPQVFRPLDGVSKEYDAVMVAGWGVYKRHHALFAALRRLRQERFRMALVGEEWKGSRAEIEGLIDLYGVRDKVIIHQRLAPSEVNEVLNRSKVNLILTLREGANKSIFEGFFADVPGIVLANNIGINKSHINEHTGRLILERELPEVLLWFRDNYPRFHPRDWAMANISPEVSTARLNEVLRQLAEKRGEPWTQDIVAKTNCPDPMYYPDDSLVKGFPSVDDLLRQYGREARGQN